MMVRIELYAGAKGGWCDVTKVGEILCEEHELVKRVAEELNIGEEIAKRAIENLGEEVFAGWVSESGKLYDELPNEAESVCQSENIYARNTYRLNDEILEPFYVLVDVREG